MPSSHLPRKPCDKFVYDFPCGIVGGYGLRHMCSHWLRASCNFFYGVSPYRDCAEIVRKSCNVSAVAVQSPQPPHGNRTEPVRGSAFARCPCGDCAMPPTTCLRATGLRFFQICQTSRYDRIVEAAEPVNPYENLTAASCLRREAARKGGYGQDTGSVYPSQAKCELGIR